VINPEANYNKESVAVMPGPGGGHVWPPWSYNPTTGLVYIPSSIGGAMAYAVDPKFEPAPTDIGSTGKGKFNMGMSFNMPRAATDPNGAGAHANVGEGPAFPPPPASSPLPTIGPAGHGNILVAWDPVAQRERWRGISAGFNQGGTLSSGNLVFVGANTRLIVYRADNGDQLMDIQTGLSMIGPPMTFMIDGKQYIALAGSPGNAPSTFGSEPAETKGPSQPSRLLVYGLDGKATLPKAPAAPASSGTPGN
jgi:quinohemoprotein ethanol dehydrogenase